jgi:hypothetical protein
MNVLAFATARFLRAASGAARRGSRVPHAVLGTIGLLGTIVLLAPVVRADDAFNVDKFSPTSDDGAKAGGMVQAFGDHFPDNPADLEVNVGGEKCMVLACQPKNITFKLPKDLKVGSIKITFKVKGSIAQVVDYQIVEKPKVRDDGTSRYQPVIDESNALLTITKFNVLGTQDPVLHVEGTTKIPMGLNILITVGFNNAVVGGDTDIASQKIVLNSSNFSWDFGPYKGRNILAGNYYATAVFELNHQPPLDVKKAGWDKLSEDQKKFREHVLNKKIQFVGTAEDGARQDKEIQDFYNGFADGTVALRDALVAAYAAAGKSYCKSTGGYNEDQWSKWLHDRQLVASDAEVATYKNDQRFVKDGYFAPDDWQAFIEESILKPALDLCQKQLDMKKHYIVFRDPRTGASGDKLLGMILSMVQQYSAELYDRNKLQLPEPLSQFKDFSSLSVSATPVTRVDFDSSVKVLKDMVVPKPLQAPKDAGGK